MSHTTYYIDEAAAIKACEYLQARGHKAEMGSEFNDASTSLKQLWAVIDHGHIITTNPVTVIPVPLVEALTNLIWSVRGLHQRFGIPDIADRRDMDVRLRIQMEELGELAQAVSRGDWDAVAEETADVLFVALGTAMVLPEVTTWLHNVAKKNDAKTLETHELVGGKIRRRNAV